jgi:hypothetical protein
VRPESESPNRGRGSWRVALPAALLALVAATTGITVVALGAGVAPAATRTTVAYGICPVASSWSGPAPDASSWSGPAPDASSWSGPAPDASSWSGATACATDAGTGTGS